MQSATTATSAFSATLKTVAANIGIMLAINVAIQLVAKAWDKLNVTVEESQEKLQETKSRLKELQDS